MLRFFTQNAWLSNIKNDIFAFLMNFWMESKRMRTIYKHVEYYIFKLAEINFISPNRMAAFTLCRIEKCFLSLFFTSAPRPNWPQFAHMSHVFIRICNLICMMTLVGHWSACLMFLVPMLNQFPNDSWVAINELQVTACCQDTTFNPVLHLQEILFHHGDVAIGS